MYRYTRRSWRSCGSNVRGCSFFTNGSRIPEILSWCILLMIVSRIILRNQYILLLGIGILTSDHVFAAQGRMRHSGDSVSFFP